MDWIRKNPHLLTLLVLAVGAIAASAMVVLSSQSHSENFSAALVTRPQGEKIPPLETTTLDQAQKEVDQPARFLTPASGNISLFVHQPMAVENGVLKRSGEGSHHDDRFTKRPIPDKWFIDNELPVTDVKVGTLDSDEDGFPNDEEWGAKTNPKDPKSHPPYYTNLFLRQVIRIQFRLRYNADDGDPKKPETMTFQINTLDLRQPSEFLKIGDTVAKTTFKLEKFEYKLSVNPSTQSEEDLSELTVLNQETGDRVVLVKGKIVNSPDERAHFEYRWTSKEKPAANEFQVRKRGKFVLVPEKELFYELVSVDDAHAVIKLPSGEQQSIGHKPADFPK